MAQDIRSRSIYSQPIKLTWQKPKQNAGLRMFAGRGLQHPLLQKGTRMPASAGNHTCMTLKAGMSTCSASLTGNNGKRNMQANNAPIQGKAADEVTIDMVLAIQAGVSYKYSQIKGGKFINENTSKLYKDYKAKMDKLTKDQQELVRNLLIEQFKNHK